MKISKLEALFVQAYLYVLDNEGWKRLFAFFPNTQKYLMANCPFRTFENSNFCEKLTRKDSVLCKIMYRVLFVLIDPV